MEKNKVQNDKIQNVKVQPDDEISNEDLDKVAGGVTTSPAIGLRSNIMISTTKV